MTLPLSRPLDGLSPVPPRETRVTHVVFPGLTNHHGTLFGGSGAAMALVAAWSLAHTRLQSEGREVPLVVVKHTATGAVDWAGSVGGSAAAILVLVGVLSVLAYFFFSVEHRGPVGGAARVGIWYLMITFGASFGFTVMGRIALLAAR